MKRERKEVETKASNGRRRYGAPRIVSEQTVFERPAQTGPICDPKVNPFC